MTNRFETKARTLGLLLVLGAVSCGGEEVRRRGSLDLAEAREAAALDLAEIGQRAPDFELETINGTRVRLSDYQGKVVVLEWLNPLCPFTRAAHESSTLKDYPAELRAEGVIWLGIDSAPEAKMGGAEDDLRTAAEAWGIEYPLLLDRDGAVGRRFDATTTPAVFLIDERGVLRYVGAIDNRPFGKVRGGGEPQNYLADALRQLRAGEPVEPGFRQSYGCRIKYAQTSLID